MIDALIMTAALHMPKEFVAQPRSGYAASEYRGRWYSEKWESIRKCIMHRESRSNYRAANSTSSARGAYQFLDSQWRMGLVWMLLEEGGNRSEIKALRHQPIHHWNRYYQDRAFFTAWQNGDGAKHWYLRGSKCNGDLS